VSRTDKVLRVLTGLTVAGLAIVAGAISFAHMKELALHHDQIGWKAYAFPVSVDGLEIVASLYLVVQRRAGRLTGWIPWVALVVGTLASLAANVAVGGNDPTGKTLAGWPALSMLVSVKLLFSMIDHVGSQQAVRDDQRPSADGVAVPGTVPGTVRDEGVPSGTVSSQRTVDGSSGTCAPATNPLCHRMAVPGDRAMPVDIRAVADLIPAAQAVRAALTADGRSLSRDALADRLRKDGWALSNARASLLLKMLKAEENVTLLGSVPAIPADSDHASERLHAAL
jgi:hypothetical protein